MIHINHVVFIQLYTMENNIIVSAKTKKQKYFQM